MASVRRIQVTETETLHRALALAHQAWPDERRSSRLIERLAVIGAEHLPSSPTREERRARITRALAPAATSFPHGYLESVREGWQ